MHLITTLCPQPDTLGDTDPNVLTVLIQNEIGGLLQAKCGEDWVVVEAVPGAIVINIGDMLQVFFRGGKMSMNCSKHVKPA